MRTAQNISRNTERGSCVPLAGHTNHVQLMSLAAQSFCVSAGSAVSLVDTFALKTSLVCTVVCGLVHTTVHDHVMLP